ncbi:hypothetical protein OPV22_032261 [Ensete ventricosum]|uniref:Uncharacterized protein n=1 Tax=Ensete ventricosum TaxID=4639 RepID=A0AAV8PP75_ENSVE|nr:hypothetical protein OPV22_032261 [Ensete ventricosum]
MTRKRGPFSAFSGDCNEVLPLCTAIALSQKLQAVLQLRHPKSMELFSWGQSLMIEALFLFSILYQNMFLLLSFAKECPYERR